jgi:hypothetical protein
MLDSDRVLCYNYIITGGEIVPLSVIKSNNF